MKISKLGSVLFAVILVITMFGCGKKSSEEYVTIAKALIHENQLDTAIIELKNAVQKVPEAPATRLLLGQLYFETGQLAAGEKELNKALELGSNVNDVLPLLSQVYYYSDQFDLASSLSLEDLTVPQALSTVSLMRYFASLRNPTGDAPFELEEVVTGLSESDKLLAQSYEAFRVRDVKQSAELLQRLKQSNYRPVDTEYLRAKLNYQQGDYASAAESFTKVNQLMPYINSVDFQEIEASIKAKLYDVAENKTDILLKINNEHPLLNLYKAKIAYAREEYEPALDFAEKSIQNGVDTPEARLIAGVSAYKVEALESAYRNLMNLSTRSGFKNSDVQRLLAHVQLSLGYNVDAVNSIRSMTDLRIEDVDLFSQAGMKLAAIGDLSGAKELLAKATKLDDSNVSSKYREAMVNIGTDENAVIDGLNVLLAQDPAVSKGWMQLAMAHIRNNEKAEAFDVAKQWYEIDKANGKALEGVIYFRYKELDNSIAAFKEALSVDPKHQGANQYLLKIYDDLDQPLNIIATAKDVLSFSPNHLQSLIAVVNAANQLGQSSAIEAYLSSLKNTDGENRGPLAAIALSKRLNGEPDEAIRLLREVDELDTLGNITLGDAYLQVGDNSAALATYQNWQVKSPEALFPALRIIAVHEMNESIEEALNVTEKSLTKFPFNNTLRMLQLHYATKLNQTSKANDLIEKLKVDNRIENSATLPYYEGQLALNAMKYEKAEKLLSIAHSASPNFISAAMLAKAMIGNGHTGQAKVMLEKQLNNGGVVPGRFKNIVASFYTHIEEYEKAAVMYENLISKHGEDAVLFNNFAFNTLMAKGDLEVAKAAAKKAVGLAPENADILDTLAWIQFKSGEKDEAYINMSKAANMNPASNQINLHFAELLISIGNTRKANEVLDKVKRPTGVESKALMQLRKSL